MFMQIVGLTSCQILSTIFSSPLHLGSRIPGCEICSLQVLDAIICLYFEEDVLVYSRPLDHWDLNLLRFTSYLPHILSIL